MSVRKKLSKLCHLALPFFPFQTPYLYPFPALTCFINLKPASSMHLKPKNKFFAFSHAQRLSLCFRPALVSALLSLSLVPLPVIADDTSTPPPTVDFIQGLAGKQVQLTWASSSGLSYRIESSADLNNWQLRSIVGADDSTASWVDPSSVGQSLYYRILLPQSEVFVVETAVISPGGTLFFHRPMSASRCAGRVSGGRHGGRHGTRHRPWGRAFQRDAADV